MGRDSAVLSFVEKWRVVCSNFVVWCGLSVDLRGERLCGPGFRSVGILENHECEQDEQVEESVEY